MDVMADRNIYRSTIQSQPSRKSQRDRILSLLAAANGGWVGLPAILDLRIALYTTRILELRRSGFEIENRTEWRDGIRHSWYRLVSRPVPEPAKPEPPKTESDYMRRRREKQAAAMPLFAEVRQ
jgi:hypothetical protein